MGKVTVKIQYCGGWGYGRFFRALEGALKDEFSADEVEIVGLQDPGRTGNFEVFLIKDGAETLIHSKTKNGQGRCETQAETDAVIAQVREAVSA